MFQQGKQILNIYHKKGTQTVRFDMCVYSPLKQTGQDREHASVMKYLNLSILLHSTPRTLSLNRSKV